MVKPTDSNPTDHYHNLRGLDFWRTGRLIIRQCFHSLTSALFSETVMAFLLPHGRRRPQALGFANGYDICNDRWGLRVEDALIGKHVHDVHVWPYERYENATGKKI